MRVILGEVPTAGASAPDPHSSSSRDGLVELRANVDDMDPRLWPAVLDACLGAGAVDAWLVPIVMKKGRPAHTLHALAYEQVVVGVAGTMLTHTTTPGVRQSPVTRQVLERAFTTVRVDGQVVQVPHGHEVTPEKLAQVEAAETVLRALGFTDSRGRHHGPIARIEVPLTELSRFADDEVRREALPAIRAAGFANVTIDLAGMQSGAFTLQVGRRG